MDSNIYVSPQPRNVFRRFVDFLWDSLTWLYAAAVISLDGNETKTERTWAQVLIGITIVVVVNTIFLFALFGEMKAGLRIACLEYFVAGIVYRLASRSWGL